MGFVWMENEEETPEDCGHVRTMFVLPELQGKGYTEQLFGYAAHVFRYQGKRVLTVSVPRLPEDPAGGGAVYLCPYAGLPGPYGP